MVQMVDALITCSTDGYYLDHQMVHVVDALITHWYTDDYNLDHQMVQMVDALITHWY